MSAAMKAESNTPLSRPGQGNRQPRVGQPAMKKIVKKALSDVRLSAKQKRELKKLVRRPDSEIDLSDIPELNAVRNPFYRPLKKERIGRG